MRSRVFHLVFTAAVLFSSVASWSPECRYDEQYCHCKMGEASQGTCWDVVQGSPGTCTRRFCKPGWTCACGGRTHLCEVGQRNALQVAEADKTQTTASCSEKTIFATKARDIKLGYFKPEFSAKGTTANACTQVAWFHNSNVIEAYSTVANMTSAKTAEELTKRTDHTLLELRPGDVLAFRFRGGSYYCFNNYVDMEVNGTKLTLDSPGVTIHYAREFSENWYDNVDYVPQYGADESETDLTKWLEPRRNMFSGTRIESQVDLWQPKDQNDADHKESNWYWRIVIPDVLPEEGTTAEASAATANL